MDETHGVLQSLAAAGLLKFRQSQEYSLLQKEHQDNLALCRSKMDPCGQQFFLQYFCIGVQGAAAVSGQPGSTPGFVILLACRKAGCVVFRAIGAAWRPETPKDRWGRPRVGWQGRRARAGWRLPSPRTPPACLWVPPAAPYPLCTSILSFYQPKMRGALRKKFFSGRAGRPGGSRPCVLILPAQHEKKIKKHEKDEKNGKPRFSGVPTRKLCREF